MASLHPLAKTIYSSLKVLSSFEPVGLFVVASKKSSPIPPGGILLEEFMKPLGMSQNRLAREIKIPPRRVNEIVRGKRGITIDTALRLSRHFGTTPEFWINLQTHYQLEVAEESDLVATIGKEVSPRATETSAR